MCASTASLNRPDVDGPEGLPHISVLRYYLPDPAYRDFVMSMKEMELASDTVIIRQSDPGNNFFAVRSGSCAVEIDGRVVRTLGTGSSCGELTLISREKRTATVIVTSPMARVLVARPKLMRRSGLLEAMERKRAEWLPFLRGSFPLLAQPLSTYELTMLVDAIRVCTLAPGEVLTRAGERNGKSFCMIRTGYIQEVEGLLTAAPLPTTTELDEGRVSSNESGKGSMDGGESERTAASGGQCSTTSMNDETSDLDSASAQLPPTRLLPPGSYFGHLDLLERRKVETAQRAAAEGGAVVGMIAKDDFFALVPLNVFAAGVNPLRYSHARRGRLGAGVVPPRTLTPGSGAGTVVGLVGVDVERVRHGSGESSKSSGTSSQDGRSPREHSNDGGSPASGSHESGGHASGESTCDPQGSNTPEFTLHHVWDF